MFGFGSVFSKVLLKLNFGRAQVWLMFGLILGELSMLEVRAFGDILKFDVRFLVDQPEFGWFSESSSRSKIGIFGFVPPLVRSKSNDTRKKVCNRLFLSTTNIYPCVIN